MGELTQTSSDRLFQVMDTTNMNFLERSAQLVMFLEDDASYVITQADSLAPKILRLSAGERREYRQLQNLFDAARRDAKNAQNLLEAANAAASMRSHLFSMQQLLLSSEGNQS